MSTSPEPRNEKARWQTPRLRVAGVDSTLNATGNGSDSENITAPAPPGPGTGS